jgi:rRNA maturation endonuclease Nob1
VIRCSSCGAKVRVGLDVCPRCGDLVDLLRRLVARLGKH